MGVVIQHTLGQEIQYVKSTLDHGEAVARALKVHQAVKLGIKIEIRRLNDTTLLIDIGGCETLGFEFKPFEKVFDKADDVGSYDRKFVPFDNRGEHYVTWPEQKMLWCQDWCKTQYAKNLVEHRFVAEIIRAIAGRCKFAKVYDEGDYYHSGRIEDASEAIQATAQVINAVGGMLGNLGFEVIKGGETTVKPIKKATK